MTAAGGAASGAAFDVDDLIDPDPALVRPTMLAVDGALPRDRARHVVRVAQRFCTFWHTGDVRFLESSVEPGYVDRTPPPGRGPGPEGAAAALAERRAGVPDLTCELADLLVAGDRFAVRLHFRGTFTGVLRGLQGSGQAIDFIAFDVLRIGPDRITDNWHLEDSLTLLTQAGLATVESV